MRLPDPAWASRALAWACTCFPCSADMLCWAVQLSLCFATACPLFAYVRLAPGYAPASQLVLRKLLRFAPALLATMNQVKSERVCLAVSCHASAIIRNSGIHRQLRISKERLF